MCHRRSTGFVSLTMIFDDRPIPRPTHVQAENVLMMVFEAGLLRSIIQIYLSGLLPNCSLSCRDNFKIVHKPPRQLSRKCINPIYNRGRVIKPCMLLSPTYSSVDSSLAQWIVSNHRLPDEPALLLLFLQPISGTVGRVISKRDIVGYSMRIIHRRIGSANDISLPASFPPFL